MLKISARLIKKSVIIFIIAIVSSLNLVSCAYNSIYYKNETDAPTSSPSFLSSGSDEGILKVHYIDVGQANSVLVQYNERFMLIDAGTGEAAQTVVNYLKNLEVETLDFFIATHPHEDHIGGAAEVLKNFTVNKIIMPEKETSTKTFENFIDEIIAKDIPVDAPEVGKDYTFKKSSFKILSPSSEEYEDLNDYSVSLKLSYGNTSFIFTGDATSVSESQMVASGLDISADVLMIGHHGSSSSSSEAFLKKVNPKYGVISVGKDNLYGHPTNKTLNKLTEMGIKFYRTDELGTIIASSDGNSISFGGPEGSVEPPEIIYIGNKSSKLFHYSWCPSVNKMSASNKVEFYSKEDCISAGYKACQNCKP